MTTAFDPGTTTGRDHPDTSFAAARRALGRTGTGRRRIMHVLSIADMTDEEMQMVLHMGPNSQRPRRLELVRLGLVEPTELRRPSISGSPAIVWTATPLGRLALTTAPD